MRILMAAVALLLAAPGSAQPPGVSGAEPPAVASETPGDAVPEAGQPPTVEETPAAPAEEAGAAEVEPPGAVEEPALEPIDWDHVIRWDDGRTEDRRTFRSAAPCAVETCVITRDGAIRLDVGARRLEVALWAIHRGQVTRIDYLEKRSKKDYVLAERIFHRRPNRSLWSISRRLEEGDIDTLYIYGVSLQYNLDQGDPIVLEVTDRDDPRAQRTYYFRYHKAGFQLSFDIGLVFPINAANLPKPKPDWRSRSVNAALTLSLRRNKDPGGRYSWFDKVVLSGHPTLFLGILNRTLERTGEVPETKTDLFVGAGITYFDFLFFGWGVNVIRHPITSCPFIGVHIGKAIKFVQDVNRTSPERWDEYLAAEREKQIVIE